MLKPELRFTDRPGSRLSFAGGKGEQPNVFVGADWRMKVGQENARAKTNATLLMVLISAHVIPAANSFNLMSKKKPRWISAETGYPFHGQARFPLYIRSYKRSCWRMVKRLRLVHEGRRGECQGKEFCYRINDPENAGCLTCGSAF